MTDKKILKNLKEIEKKFGIMAYEEIKKLIGSLLQKNERLKLSRDNWRSRYMKLKNS